MLGFENRKPFSSFNSFGAVGLNLNLDSKQTERLDRIRRYWNFYDGYHWEDIPSQENQEITINYCRAFVDKFVAFELGKAFTFSTHKNMVDKKVTRDGRTLFEYLEDIWEDNNQYLFIMDVGQMKSVTGDAWVQVKYTDEKEIAESDPFNEYPEGRIELLLMSTGVIFPEYDPHVKGKLTSLSIIYNYEEYVEKGLSGKLVKQTSTFKQIWTKDTVTTHMGKNEEVVTNKYGIIPFVQIKNLPVSNKNEGRSDLEDIIPMNMEFDMKKSDASAILDYHASPVTVVYGAKIGNLEKGANKMWGGISKDARIENLEMKSDLGASSNYIADLKLSMCEVAGIPETVLGGAQAISNTSGVALQYINLPLIEKTRTKIASTENGLERLNKMIIYISTLEGILIKPNDVPSRDFFFTEVNIPDTLPKDALLELQQIQAEMKLGLESREGALKRLGREDIEKTLIQVSEDKELNPQFYGIMPNRFGEEDNTQQINSGMLNGETANDDGSKENPVDKEIK